MAKPTVLIVEDNPEYQELLKLGFERSRPAFQFEFCSSAEQAQQYLEQPIYRPLLILLDYDLPGINGLELLSQLKESPRYNHVPVLMFSMFTTDELMTKAYKLGVNAYLSKPEDLSGMLSFWSALTMFWSHSAQVPRIND
ncbi:MULTISPECIES: response regulator [unclassified Siphonobacter]|uniref:response regulator n=1 Tax=unclassified Siphonobacter TaxID=2635712 RepID=UPI000CC4111B|nr:MULTISPECIES: response regulator [unclassified Siphonobacter]MDQ1090288.1 CheY-like chemotaxis protein [Siphonobacter sp. SORGH_AS_1065]MDR6198039.1 CheY-like chemotaxis protein [Siphonobacter sp. SORGH_AS_0500]PKK35001.1 hypothetical protein BWI96_19420 [Siphonobacter sp. SORGH_AS_0500]